MKKQHLDVGGIIYKTQGAMEAKARAIIDSWSYGITQTCSFFEELFKRHHHYISSEVHPTEFRRMINPKYYDTRHIEVRCPGGEWTSESWKKAISMKTKEESLAKEIRTSLRQLYQGQPMGSCKAPGCKHAAEDCHHVSPEFEEIVSILIPLITPEELKGMEEAEITYDFKEDSKVVRQFRAMSKYFITENLCKKCHHTLKGKKNTSITGAVIPIPPEIYFDYTDKIVERDAYLGYGVNRALLVESDDTDIEMSEELESSLCGIIREPEAPKDLKEAEAPKDLKEADISINDLLDSI
jgi:hypothetical protein